MIKANKRALSLILMFVLLIFGISNVSAETQNGTETQFNIYFEVPESWIGYQKIYCYANFYGSTEILVKWQSEETECMQVSNGLYVYNLSKICKIENDKYYTIIFSSDKHDQTFDILLSIDSIGDTICCDNNIFELPNNLKCNMAYWKTTTPTIFGDANLDRKFNIKDATYIQKYLAKIELRSELWESILDTNLDGKITISDATHLQKKLASL